MAEPSTTPTKPKRTKVTLACLLCRKKKVKCDGTQPTCSRCTAKGHVCEYSERTRPRGPLKRHGDVIENRAKRVAKLHSRNRSLLDSRQKDDHNSHYDDHASLDDPLMGQRGAGGGATSSSSNSTGSSEPTSPNTTSAADADADADTAVVAPASYQLTKANAILELVLGAVKAVKDKWEADYQLTGGPLTTLSNNVVPHSVQMQLAEKYFNNFNLFLPLLSRHHYFHRLAHYPEKMDPMLCYAVCAMGTRYLQFRDDLERLYFERCLSLLDNLKNEQVTLSSLQAVIIMCWYTFLMGDFSKSAELQRCLLRFVRLLQLGKNAEPTLTMVQHELRRRTFWSIYVTDGLLSFYTNMHLIYMDKEGWDIKKPILEDDQLNKLDHRELKWRVPQPSALRDDTTEASLQMASFTELIELASIMGDMFDCHRRRRKSPESDENDQTSSNSNSHLELRLNDWFLHLPSYLEYNYAPVATHGGAAVTSTSARHGQGTKKLAKKEQSDASVATLQRSPPATTISTTTNAGNDDKDVDMDQDDGGDHQKERNDGNNAGDENDDDDDDTHEDPPAPIAKTIRILYHTTQIILYQSGLTASDKRTCQAVCRRAADAIIHIADQMMQYREELKVYNIFSMSITLAASIHLDLTLKHHPLSPQLKERLGRTMGVLKDANCSYLSHTDFGRLVDRYLTNRCKLTLTDDFRSRTQRGFANIIRERARQPTSTPSVSDAQHHPHSQQLQQQQQQHQQQQQLQQHHQHQHQQQALLRSPWSQQHQHHHHSPQEAMASPHHPSSLHASNHVLAAAATSPSSGMPMSSPSSSSSPSSVPASAAALLATPSPIPPSMIFPYLSRATSNFMHNVAFPPAPYQPQPQPGPASPSLLASPHETTHHHQHNNDTLNAASINVAADQAFLAANATAAMPMHIIAQPSDLDGLLNDSMTELIFSGYEQATALFDNLNASTNASYTTLMDTTTTPTQQTKEEQHPQQQQQQPSPTQQQQQPSSSVPSSSASSASSVSSSFALPNSTSTPTYTTPSSQQHPHPHPHPQQQASPSTHPPIASASPSPTSPPPPAAQLPKDETIRLVDPSSYYI